MEYVDVGDRVRFSSPVATHISLERGPPAHPRPSGESWYGYGTSSADATGIPISRTWTPRHVVSLRTETAESTHVRYRTLANATIQIPEPITGVAVNGLCTPSRIMATSRLGGRGRRPLHRAFRGTHERDLDPLGVAGS